MAEYLKKRIDLRLILPSIHIFLFSATAIAGEKSASGGNPLFCVDLPISLPFVASDSTRVFVIVGIIATVWWYFIAQIGWSSIEGRISRVGSAMGALLIAFLCLCGGGAMASEFFCCIRDEPTLSIVDAVIYVLAIGLLVGGLLSATFSAINAFGLNKSESSTPHHP